MQKVVGSNPISRFIKPGPEPRSRLRTAARLLPQPHCFEGFGLIDVAPEASDLAVAELIDMIDAHLDRHATAPPLCRGSNWHQYALARLDEPLRFKPKVLSGFDEPLGPRSHLHMTAMNPRIRNVGGVMQLGIRAMHGKPARNVSRVERLVGAARDLDVLLRHRLL